ncbi:MAG: DUF4923 family protein [Bacteroidales bacterium]|jgi:hypothetical protein|nr:DUF4923 family protein [Bacteroidales bacterium]
MKRHRFTATALLCCALTVSGCGLIKTASALGSIFGSRKKASTVTTIVKILGSVLGQFYDTTTKAALVGNWTYDEPAIQFESENMLKKAGGVVASESVAGNISPYFEKMGFKPGSISLQLREDNTCSYFIGDRYFEGTYDFDDTNKKITLKTPLFPLPAAYLSVVGDQMAVTYDSSKLLSLIQVLGFASNQPTLNAVSNLADSYDGMKTGFTFKRVK